MIDENFKEAVKRSSDGKFLCRLFRIGSDDGSIHMSISVEEGGRTLYKLPENYWLGIQELLDWDKDQNILFFTVNGRTKVFIYDVTFMTIVSYDILPTDELRWDDVRKQWEINSHYNIIKGDLRQSGVLRNTLALPYANDVEQPQYKILPTNKSQIYIVLKKVEKTLPVQPDLWEIGILNTKTLTWMVETLPYLVKGESSIHLCRHDVLSCYGFSKKGFNVVIFRCEFDEIETKNCVSLYVHDNGQAQSMSWDNSDEWWRMVVNNKVIYPGRFYYDNIYNDTVYVKPVPIQNEILELLPLDRQARKHIEETKGESGNDNPPEVSSPPMEEPIRFALPRDQRRWMILFSVLMLLVLFGLWALFLDGPTQGTMVMVLMVSIIAGIALVVVGRDVRHHAKRPHYYNIGCWLLWAGIWFALAAVASIVASLSMIVDDVSQYAR